METPKSTQLIPTKKNISHHVYDFNWFYGWYVYHSQSVITTLHCKLPTIQGMTAKSAKVRDGHQRQTEVVEADVGGKGEAKQQHRRLAKHLSLWKK